MALINFFWRTKWFWLLAIVGIVGILLTSCANTLPRQTAVPAIQTPQCPQRYKCPECEVCEEVVIVNCYKTEGIVVYFSYLDDDGNSIPEKKITGRVDDPGCRCLVRFEDTNWFSTMPVDDVWCMEDEE